MTTARPLRGSAAALALAIAVLPLAACGDDGAPAATDAPPEASATEPPAAVPSPDRLDLVARDYTWDGLPDRLAAGDYPVTLRNEGSELHEISVFRNPDGLPLDDLHALGPVGIAERVEMAGTILAGAGTSGEGLLDLAPGTYEVVCFVPAAADGSPHFDHGMHRTLEVVAP